MATKGVSSSPVNQEKQYRKHGPYERIIIAKDYGVRKKPKTLQLEGGHESAEFAGR
jgi:hypothetical protein